MSPKYEVLATLMPPATTNAAVLVPEAVLYKCTWPPTFKFSPIPTPPTTVNAPVLVEVELVVLEICNSPA